MNISKRDLSVPELRALLCLARQAWGILQAAGRQDEAAQVMAQIRRYELELKQRTKDAPK